MFAQRGVLEPVKIHSIVSIFLMLVVWFGMATLINAQELQITYGDKGLETLSYRGVVLEDNGAHPVDLFHIWHMKATDLRGNLLTSGQYGWGETNSGESWNSVTKTETYLFNWGSISVSFAQKGSQLDMTVTEKNDYGSGIVLDGAEIFPLALHFPQDPVGFYGYSQYAITTRGPGVSEADFGSATVTSVLPNESLALYGGWKNLAPSIYSPIMTSTAPDGLPTFLPRTDLPLNPGKSLTYTVSLRFTPEGTKPNIADAYASFESTYPSKMTWSDKRILGTAYLAGSPASDGNANSPGGYATNPRRYFNDPSVNITTAAGLEDFQMRILQQASANAANASAMNSQAIITWDIEGEEYPQETSYVCSPDKVGSIAPEMESRVKMTSSAYYGMKLDDAYFKIMVDAGLKVGVCLRPQVFTTSPNGSASQVFLADEHSIIQNLALKAKIANQRWGATIFYVDSTVDANGGTLDAAIFEQLITDYPGFLFIPEESTPRYYAYSAPFYSFIFHGTTGTDSSVYGYYPKAFGANLVNDVSSSALAQSEAALKQSVIKGDILMGHADYWDANDPTLISIYKSAGVK